MAGWIRGHVLTPRPHGGIHFERDSLLGWDDDGRLIAQQGTGGDGPLLIPGLIDAHVHLPQYRVRGRFSEALLPWLRNHIWPEEERFAEFEYRQGVTSEFRAGLIANGTTSAMVYGSPEADSTHAVLRDLAPLTIKGGDVLMDRNSPDGLLRDRAASLVDAAAHVQEYGERYALTPRFAPTCTEELMAGCGELLAAGQVRMQTHLAENLDEVAWVAELHPDDRSYLAVYDRLGLLGPRSVFGHCIHLDDADLACMAETGSWIAHCPTSNIALGSGRMPIERVMRAGVNWALATDVGAGPDLSMLDVMRAFCEVHAEHADAGPGLALAGATWLGAQAIGESRARGALVPGKQADIVALEIPGGLGRGEHGLDALARILTTFEGRYEEAVLEVVAGGARLKR
ncbi:MAG: amidohydrolase family protein [Proteobacteria bacterium]|nr:amidohydrolase family protein [Pseudomonadota bacterium]